MLLLVIDVAGSLLIPTLAAQMLNLGISAHSFQKLIETGLWMAAASLVSGICAILGGYACAALSARVGQDMRVAVYDKSLKLSVYDFRQFGTASITTRTISDITNIQMALTSFIQMVLPVPVIIVLAVILTFNLDMQFGFVLLCAVAAVLILALFIMRSASPLFRKLQKLLDRMSKILLENITGVRVVRAFNNEQREETRLNESFSSYAKTSIKANRLFANLDGLSFFFINLLIVVIYWMSGGHISSGILQIGDITAVIEYAMMVLFFIMMAQMVIMTMPRALECCSRVQNVLDHSPEIVDYVNTDPQIDEKNNQVLAFDHVTFRYNKQSEKPVLDDLNFEIKAGETIGILGGTGSSKTSLVNLISRLYDVNEGTVYVGGKDVRSYDLETLRNEVSVVLQKNVLFSGTILENLRWGDENATEEECIRACRLACADEFIEKMPEKYNTYIEQGGSNVSGGQKQRLCIARALLKKPKVLILDDSTSAVDTATDAKIRKAFATEIPGTTKIIIAQRISSIQDADRIIVMDNGKIDAFAPHEELLRTNEIYKEVYEAQTQTGGGDFDENGGES